MNPLELINTLKNVDDQFFNSPSLTHQDFEFLYTLLSANIQTKYNRRQAEKNKKISVLLANYNSSKSSAGSAHQAAGSVRYYLPPEVQSLVDRMITATCRNPDLPNELISRLRSRAGQIPFKDRQLGDLVETKASNEPQDIEITEDYSKEKAEVVIWSCQTINDNPLHEIPQEISEILHKELFTNLTIRRLEEWKEARDNVVILRILRGGQRQDVEDRDYRGTLLKGSGKAFSEATAGWKKKKPNCLGLVFSFCRLSTLPKEFIDYLMTSDEHSLYLGYNIFGNLPDSFALLASSKLKFLELKSNVLQKIPSWMGEFKNLTTLDLRGNPALSRESIEELQKKLPNSIILHDYKT